MKARLYAAFCVWVALELGAGDMTGAIQARIDARSASGGGTVTLAAGEYPVAALFLRDNVTLELKRGATLVASTNRSDYVSVLGATKGWSRGQVGVVCASGVTNVALVGEGTVDGRGWAIAESERDNEPGRWKDVFFYRCRDCRVEGVSLVNAASWTCYFKECTRVRVCDVTIRSMTNYNNDGIDIDAKDVLVENCRIESDDDAVCLKSDNPRFVCEDVEVRNCRIASNCNHIKLGTSSRGGFRRVRIHDCDLVSCSTNIVPQRKNRAGSGNDVPGWDKRDIASRVGIALECVDGGVLDDVIVRDIRMTRCCQTPIFVRLGRRAVHPSGRPAELKNVLIENVTGESASWIASSITGVPGLRPHDVTVRNVTLRLKGGGRIKDAAHPVPENEAGYPENRMFGKGMLPAAGFYVRHADRVRFENVRLFWTGDSEERPPFVVDDADVFVDDDCIPGTSAATSDVWGEPLRTGWWASDGGAVLVETGSRDVVRFNY